MGQEASSTPPISMGERTLEVVENFTYLGATISSNLSIDAELNTRIGKVTTAVFRLAKRVWDNSMLTANIKMRLYQACVLCTLLDGSESRTLHARQKRKPTPSTCPMPGGLGGSLGKTASSTRMSWPRQQYQACLL